MPYTDIKNRKIDLTAGIWPKLEPIFVGAQQPQTMQKLTILICICNLCCDDMCKLPSWDYNMQ